MKKVIKKLGKKYIVKLNNANYKLTLFNLTFFLLTISYANGQVFHSRTCINCVYNKNEGRGIPVRGVYVDSLRLETSTNSIIHFHLESDSLKNKLLFDSGENVFKDSTNGYSRLIFIKDGRTIFNIATPPLTNLIYNESAGLIIGLSKIIISPYHVVIYDLNGKLLAKRSLGALELIFTYNELRDLIGKYPDLLKCINESIIVKRNDSLILEISTCLINTLGREKLRGLAKFSSSQFFPTMISPIHGGIYSKYFNSFSDSDPLYDIIMIGSVPYLITLNSEDGRKVNIPLVSNFSMFR